MLCEVAYQHAIAERQLNSSQHRVLRPRHNATWLRRVLQDLGWRFVFRQRLYAMRSLLLLYLVHDLLQLVSADGSAAHVFAS